jgi:quercetin dioxygenase-like cupin family protein
VSGRAAHVVDLEHVETIDVLGPTVQILATAEDDGGPCLMRGVIGPGVAVPLHTHADPETFVVESGALEGLVDAGDGARWVPIRAGDVFHVPGNARHAFRNSSAQPAVTLMTTTTRIARFFREIAGPPSPEAIERFLRVSERYGYWNAMPEENAAVGVALPTP